MIESYTDYETLNGQVILSTRTVIEKEQLQEIIEGGLYGNCPACYSKQFNDGDIICDACYEKATEEREKYR